MQTFILINHGYDTLGSVKVVDTLKLAGLPNVGRLPCDVFIELKDIKDAWHNSVEGLLTWVDGSLGKVVALSEEELPGNPPVWVYEQKDEFCKPSSICEVKTANYPQEDLPGNPVEWENPNLYPSSTCDMSVTMDGSTSNTRVTTKAKMFDSSIR